MKKLFALLFVSLITFAFLSVSSVYAVENPLARPNNKIGIHILFDTELSEAAKLVNSNGGDWGYVTIPILIHDMNQTKWQRFMDSAKKHHVIPIIRLATNPHPDANKYWRKPTAYDIAAFANFLNQLQWPTKNRFVIIFNEVNRADEWGGEVNPAEYARILDTAVTTFKAKNPDFFIISAGLDNAAPNQQPKFMNQYDYMREMNTAVPGIFGRVDSLSSHSYPNPAFAQPPDSTNTMGAGSFLHERELAKQLSGGKSIPVIITETGWSTEVVAIETIMQYYQEAFATIWNDPNIIAITPFIMDARGGPFQKFSFLTETGGYTQQYTLLKELVKQRGEPAMPPTPIKVLAAETEKEPTEEPAPVPEKKQSLLKEIIESLFGWIKR